MVNPRTRKQYPAPSSPQTVSHATAARILADPGEVRVLARFVHRERSLAEVARATGETPERLFACVQRLVRYGLLFVTRTERHGPSAERYYHAAAEYVIPAAVVPPAEWWSRANERWDRRFLQAIERDQFPLISHVKLVLHGSGEVHVSAAAPAAGGRTVIPRAVSDCGCVALHADQLPAFRRAFAALLAQFAAPEGEGAEAYLYRMALAPLSSDD